MPNNYYLMHKDVSVATISLDADNGRMLDVEKLLVPEHLPLGVFHNNALNRKEIKSWWDGRSIPASRDKIELLLKKLDINDTTALLTKSLGLSLSDCYWIQPVGANVRWADVNYYENDFSADIGNVMFGRDSEGQNINEASPDNTSDGWLKKRWKIINGERVLIKAGSEPFEQEPLNEVIASRLMDELGIKHVKYELFPEQRKTYCICPCFTSPEVEFVAASRVISLQKTRGSESPYNHYISVCESLGLDNAKTAVDKMIFIDYVIANSDRHYNNFGILRNPDTLQPISLAPIFDSGSSLGYNRSAHSMLYDPKDPAKPFRSTHQEQIKLVKDLSWVRLAGLMKFEDIVRDVFLGKEDALGASRIESIVKAGKRRINDLFGREMLASFRGTIVFQQDIAPVENNVSLSKSEQKLIEVAEECQRLANEQAGFVRQENKDRDKIRQERDDELTPGDD